MPYLHGIVPLVGKLLYKGKIKKEEFSILTALVYLSFFGQISSGPIARYSSFVKRITFSKEERNALLSDGAVRFLKGFCKKVLLANVLSNIVVEVFDKTGTLSTGLAWLGSICYSLQLYYDFSGYSDMAIGISNLFGYECPENFRYPYMTKSVSEFWRRWHITLGSWFRDYVYIPLGGSRVGKARLYLNLFVVWILTGLWYGADWNFVAWGLGYFVLIAFEKASGLPEKIRSKPLQLLYRIAVILIINFQWVMFRVSGFGAGMAFMKRMVIPCRLTVQDARALFLLKDYKWFLVFAILFAFPIVPAIEKACKNKKTAYIIYQVVSAAVLILLGAAALSFVTSGQNNPFLYANF